ncbi:MAG: hypothetical protein QOE65_2722 [Solirubrobacteraceae bacterium]|jgi:hypothetical protein|nr:hypothetical protein [Solirubrobacteraceae bacterium]
MRPDVAVAPATGGRVEQVPMPPEARALATLDRIDYTDAFRAESAHADALTGEEWARAFLEGAPARLRRDLVWGWRAIGLRLGSTGDPDRVLGWEIRRRGPDHALLAARSWLGVSAEVLAKRDEGEVLVASFVRWHHPLGRLLCAAIAPHHRRVVAHLLGRATSLRSARRSEGLQAVSASPAPGRGAHNRP